MNNRRHLKRNNRGMLLVIALTILFILVMLSAVLITLGQNSRRDVLTARRKNEIEQAIDNGQIRVLTALQPDPVPGKSPLPPTPTPMPTKGSFTISPPFDSSQKVVLSGKWEKGASINRPVPGTAASDVEKMPAVGYDKGNKAEDNTGYKNTWVPPWHTFLAMNTNDGKSYLTMFSAAFPYGVAAPNGSITLDSAASGSNPTIADMKNLSKEEKELRGYSSVPVDLIAKNDILVRNEYKYGKAFTEKTDSITFPKGSGYGFSGRASEVANARNIVDHIVNTQITKAADEISKDTLDKTGYITGKPLTDPVVFIKDIIQGKFVLLLHQMLSVEQGMQFPFPTLPLVSYIADQDTFEISLHCPLPPDISKPISKDDKKKIKEIKELSDKWKDKDYDTLTDDEKKEYTEDMEKIKELKDELGTGKGWDPKGVPNTLLEEMKYDSTGWPYGQIVKDVIVKVVNLIKDTISTGGDFTQLVRNLPMEFVKMVTEATRMVHYRGKAPDITFEKDDSGFTWDSNWTVPRGRTLKISKNVTLKGDLWIQDGATLYIDGNLTLVNQTLLPVGPTGKVYLGKGSSLIVEKNLILAGDQWFGSVIVDSPLGGTDYLSSAIIVKGKAIIPYGTTPGVSLSNLVGTLTDKPGLKKFIDTINDVAPQASKILGPFQARICWFASHPASVRFLIIEIEGIPIPIPEPIPDMGKNYARPLFSILSVGYQLWLNSNLGENLYTENVWWILTRGVVPIFPKIAGIETSLDKLKTIDVVHIAEDIGEEFITKILPKVAEEAITDIVTEIVTLIVNAIIQELTGTGIDLSDKDAFDEMMKDLRKEIEKVFISAIKKALKDTLSEVLTELVVELRNFLEKGLTLKFYEVPGVLIYAGDSLIIGQTDKGRSTDANFAAGLFISKGDVMIDVDQTMGCIISQNGSVTAKDFLYYPYFTRASLNVPKKLGDIKNFFEFTPPKSSETVEVGVPMYHITGESWEK